MGSRWSDVVRGAPARLLRYGWIVAGPVLVVAVVGDIGFSPTDEGFVLSQSWRLLHGELPHADFVSPRPLGSAFLHVVDFAVPLPLLEATRLVAALQVALYSALLARFVFGVPMHRWSAFHVLAAAVSALVNLHVFPLMAWHTIDGITLLAAGLVLIAAGLDGVPRKTWAGMACVGAAALVKQSFVPALPVAGLWVLWASRSPSWRETARRCAAPALAAAAPVVAYLVVVALGSGLDDMAHQFRAADEQRVYGQGLVDVFDNAEATDDLAWLVGIVAAGALTTALLPVVRQTFGRRVLWPAAAAALAAMACVGIALVRFPYDERYAYNLPWGIVLFWALAVVVAVRALVRRRVPWRPIAILFIAWMTMLSWGYAVPQLVSGTVVLAAVHLVVEDAEFDRRARRLLRLPLVSMAALGLVVTADGVFDARRDDPYFDRPEQELSFELSGVHSAFGDARTNPATGGYMADVSDCIRRHPASRVAVLPDYPGAYAYLRIRNPFPIDWMLDAEVQGSQDRILDAAERLDRRGDYLVLFSATSAFHLETLAEPLPPGVVTKDSFVHHEALGSRIAVRLFGKHVPCGSFTAVYDPGGNRPRRAGTAR